nr:sugar-transfer associated ATP-grasp domain-containing protein [uncultured Draconibacterium sp.]
MKFFNRLSRILRRNVPYAIFSWRYLLPGQSAVVRLHKLVFLHAFLGESRVVWFVIALFSYTRWFAFQGWIQLWTVWKKLSPVLQEETGITRNKQFADLLKLVFGQTTPPLFYYSYRLYCYSTIEWLNFIYTHELPNWHLLMSPNLGEKTRNTLTDKAVFAQEMQKRGLPVIKGDVIVKGSIVSNKQLFRQSSLFLKPLCGSQQNGIYRLFYQESSGGYSLILSEDDEINNCEQIITFVQSLINEQDYLVQPMLQNHPVLQVFSSFKTLITIRLITICTDNKAKAISAVLELPRNDYSGYIYALPVDVCEGIIEKITDFPVTYSDEMCQMLRRFVGQAVIHWRELVDVALRAHTNFSDLYSIGWDLAVTPEGVKLIEGNINWAVAPHQLNGPALMPYFIKYAKPNLKQTK